MALADRKIYALNANMVHFPDKCVGSGYYLTHEWFETYTPWVPTREEIQPILDQLGHMDNPVWYETQGCTFRSKPDQEFRLRLRFSNLNDALLVKLAVDV